MKVSSSGKVNASYDRVDYISVHDTGMGVETAESTTVVGNSLGSASAVDSPVFSRSSLRGIGGIVIEVRLSTVLPGNLKGVMRGNIVGTLTNL